MIVGTAAMWVAALTDGVHWDQERDTPRIRKAFVTLAQTRTHWPAPLHFREALPPSKQLRLPGRGERPVDPPELVEAMEAVKRGDPIQQARELTSKERREWKNLDDVERELKQHYGTDRKSAAAGDS